MCYTHGTRSPGNTRSSRTGVGERISAPTGTYIRYPSWAEGWRDLAFRLVDPQYVYHQEARRTIRSIIVRWAPREDGNDPELYIARVVRNSDGWSDLAYRQSPPPPFDGNDKQVGETLFHAAASTVEVAVEGLRCRQWADPASCETRVPLRRGEHFEALYWINGVVVGGERRWWVARSGSRIWSGGTIQKPGED